MVRFYKRISLSVIYTLAMCAILSGNNLFGQTTQNVNLLANWDNPALPNIGGESYNDVWGYAANGREYAFIGTNADVTIFDVTVASSPVLLTKLAGGSNSSIWRDIKTYQNYLYCISDQGAGSSLQIFDLSGLPGAVTKVYDSQAFFTTAHNLFISEQSGYMYVAGANTQPNGVIMLDLANPILPTQIASFTLGGYTHDVYVHNDTLYSFMGSFGISAFDFSPSGPNQMGALTTYPNQGYTHSGWASSDNKTLYWIDETHDADVHWMDISDPWNLTVGGSFKSALEAPTYTNSVAHNMMVRDSFLLIAYYQDGLQIYNISNPTSPVKYGHYDTFSNVDYTGTSGAWGIYSKLPSGNILVSDTQNGLFVLQAQVSFPVTMTSFEAYQDESAVRLEWATASESNSDRFEVERSGDGANFENIGEVAAAGNSTVHLDYQFIDRSPLTGGNYYRLKQVDLNGSVTYSEIRIINNEGQLGFTLFPNPLVQGRQAKIQIEMPKASDLNLTVTDMLGRKITGQMMSLHSGLQTVELATSDLAPGAYLVRLEGGGLFAEKSLIVTN